MEFLRHIVTKEDINEKKFFFFDKEMEKAKELFEDFFERKFNLFVNNVSWGRGKFTIEEKRIFFELNKSFFRGVTKDSTIELEVVDGITVELRSSPPVDEFLKSLNSNDINDIIMAVRKIGETRNEKGISPLITVLKHKNEQVRVSVVRALSKFEMRDEIEPELIGMLKDISDNVRSRTCDALANYNSKNSINALIEATKDKSKTVDWAARLALRELNVEGFNTAELDI